VRDVLEAFATTVDVLVDLDGRFLHHGVGLLGPTHKLEIFTAR